MEPSVYEKLFGCAFVGVEGIVGSSEGVRKIFGEAYNFYFDFKLQLELYTPIVKILLEKNKNS